MLETHPYPHPGPLRAREFPKLGKGANPLSKPSFCPVSQHSSSEKEQKLKAPEFKGSRGGGQRGGCGESPGAACQDN